MLMSLGVKQDPKMQMQTCSVDCLYLMPQEVLLLGETLLLLENLAASSITVSQIRTATARDPMLSRVAQMVQQLD